MVGFGGIVLPYGTVLDGPLPGAAGSSEQFIGVIGDRRDSMSQPEDRSATTTKHVLVVLTEPVPGLEDEYNEWYTGTHLDEVVATPGFISAQRFQLADDGMSLCSHSYLAIYEVEGDLEAAKAALAAGRDRRVPLPAALSDERKVWWFTTLTERVEAPARDRSR
jgi:hypothetical protein